MRIVVLTALLVLASSCQRSNDVPSSTDSAEKIPASAKLVEKVPAAPQTKGDEGGSCGDGMKGGGSCSRGCNQWDEAANDVLRRELPADAKWTKLAVEGMTCGGCERRVIANVGALDGVLKVEADAELGEVRVATTKQAPIVASAVAKIQSLGYRVVD